MGAISRIKNLVLIGLPGSGKTTLGNIIAHKTRCPFIDTDGLIEETTGKEISEIFARDGEGFFREVEKEIVSHVSQTENTVITTGGGAWLDPENRKNLKKNGIIIYLTCELTELWERIKASSEVRPLLKGGFESLKKLYRERHELYQKADYMVDTTGKSAEEVWEEIAEKIGGSFGKKSISDLQEDRFTIETGQKNYDFIAGHYIMSSAGEYLKDLYEDSIFPRVFLITNPLVNAICGETVRSSLRTTGFDVSTFIVPDGEQYKSLARAEKIYSELSGRGFDRGDVILSLGGGVIGDLAGFAAATYMRGIPWVNMPTTLLAQVDSSIGGKTAVNLPAGKNLVGAFYQPDAVLADLELLQYLSQYHYRQGLAECIKYAILEEKIFEFIEDNIKKIKAREPAVLQQLVIACGRIKGKIVGQDEREKGLRVVLNLGHTVGHALEGTIGYGRIGHGDAVALGIRAEAFIGVHLGFLSRGTLKRIEDLLTAFDFASKIHFSSSRAIEFMQRDKKRKRGKSRIVIPVKIGAVQTVEGIDKDVLEKSLQYIGDGEV